ALKSIVEEKGSGNRDQGLGWEDAGNCGGVSVEAAGDAARNGDAADERQAAGDVVQCAGRERGGREVCGSVRGLRSGGNRGDQPRCGVCVVRGEGAACGGGDARESSGAEDCGWICAGGSWSGEAARFPWQRRAGRGGCG